MPVITLSREMGSGGDDIAVEVARRLGLQLAGRDVINQAARQAGVPEVALADIDELGLLGLKPGSQALQRYRQTAEKLIGEMADAGDLLLVGRGGQIVLANRPGVLRVRIGAPLDVRLRHVQSRCRVTSEGAAAIIAASDKARAAYLRRHYHANLANPLLYDIVLNMSQFTVADAVDIICKAAARLERTLRQGANHKGAG